MRPEQKKTILIIDDNPGDQLLLQDNLLSTGLEIENIIMADNLEEGMVFIRQKNISLLFLDLFLPDGDGLHTLSAIIKFNQKLPIVIYSGLADTDMAVKAIGLGAQDFLIKGEFSIALLEKTVRYSIERKFTLDALEESNKRYSILSKATHDMVWDWDLEKNTIYRNPEGWNKIFRTSVYDGTGNKADWSHRVHPDDRKKMQDIIESAISNNTQDLFEAEFRIIRDDGTLGCIEDRGYIIRNEKGRAIRIIGASHDISERKNAEHKVMLSEQRFKALVQNSNDLLAILDVDGNYIYNSPTSKNLLGYDPEFFQDKNPFSFIHEDDRQMTQDCLAEIIEKKYLRVPLFRFKHASGEWRWLESVATNMLDDPAVRGIVVNSRDVTERKIADDEIEKLSMVAKKTLSGVFILNKDKEIQWVNDAFSTITEFSFAEVIGKKPSTFLYGKDPDPAIFEELFKMIGSGTTYEGERCYYTKSGKPVYVWLQLQTLLDSKGNPIQYFGVQTDITRQKELEEKVEQEKLLKQKQITDAVYGAQENERSEIGRELHDNVNQLLGATRLYINMARTDEDSRDSLLTDASAFTLNAIEEIRKLSKTLITPLIKEIGLVDSIKELADEIMIAHPVRIEVIDGNFKEEELNEKFKLNIFRIAQEQLNNILKHAQAKQVKILINMNEHNLIIVIADDGIGFDTTKRKNGIGITNIKSRSELYNGIVELHSELGKGTSLAVTFNKNDLLQADRKQVVTF